MNNGLLTIKEAALFLRVHRKTVEKWRREGVLESVRVGNRWRIPMAAIEKYLGREE